MSTRTLAVGSQVYDRLAGARRKGEFFSNVIDHLLDEVGAVHTGRDILPRGRPVFAIDSAGLLMHIYCRSAG
jgi:hypothetical protein